MGDRTRSLFRRRLRTLFVLGSLLYMSASFPPITTAQKKHPPAKPLDLNTATVEQLEQLPGIGPSTAKAIVQFREKSGPFERIEDLLAIHGISRKKLEKLRPYVIIRSPAGKIHSLERGQPCPKYLVR